MVKDGQCVQSSTLRECVINWRVYSRRPKKSVMRNKQTVCKATIFPKEFGGLTKLGVTPGGGGMAPTIIPGGIEDMVLV
jgi:hypothetical protein